MGAIRPRNAWGDYKEVGGVELIPAGGRGIVGQYKFLY